MEIIISRENPYKLLFSQIDEYNPSIYYGDIKIALAFEWGDKKYSTDKYEMSIPYSWLEGDYALDLEEASRILAVLSVIGYRHKRYKYE